MLSLFGTSVRALDVLYRFQVIRRQFTTPYSKMNKLREHLWTESEGIQLMYPQIFVSISDAGSLTPTIWALCILSESRSYWGKLILIILLKQSSSFHSVYTNI